MMSTQQILVVDDDKSIIKIVQAYLKQAGYTVLTAYNGTSAMHILYSEKPDLLILDLMLPDRDGWEITTSIRNDKRLATIPIIMLTARIEELLAQLARRLQLRRNTCPIRRRTHRGRNCGGMTCCNDIGSIRGYERVAAAKVQGG